MIAKLLISQNLLAQKDYINRYLESANLKKNHPDVLCFKAGEKLGVEQAKQIRKFLSVKAFSAEGKTVIIEEGSALTAEAQNALLKTIEELPSQNTLVIAASSESGFLPTILSRCIIVRLQGTDSSKEEKDYKEDIEKLITSSTAERFEYVEKLKDREAFLNALAAYFHQNLPSHSSSGKVKLVVFTKENLEAERWAKQNVNIRAILEYLMLIMPERT